MTLSENQSLQVSIFSKWTSVILVMCLFLLRPSALGQNITPVGLFIVTLIAGLYVLKKNGVIRTSRRALEGLLFLAILAVSYFLYEGIIAIIFGKSNLVYYLKEVVSAVIVIVGYGIFLIDSSNNRVFFRQTCVVVAVLGWSHVATLLLCQIVDPSALLITRIPIEGYENVGAKGVEMGTIYFPVSMTYGQVEIMGHQVMRFCGFFREPGIFQAVACFCLAIESLTSRTRWVLIGLILGILTTLSTAGYFLMFFIIGAVNIVQGNITFIKGMAAIITVVVGLYAVFQMPGIGISSKASSGGGSITDRVEGVQSGINTFLINPLGNGPFSNSNKYEAICLLASISSIGLLGFVLQVTILSGIRNGPSWLRLRRVIACTPLLLTALISQPIAGAAVLYVFVMLWL